MIEFRPSAYSGLEWLDALVLAMFAVIAVPPMIIYIIYILRRFNRIWIEALNYKTGKIGEYIAAQLAQRYIEGKEISERDKHTIHNEDNNHNSEWALHRGSDGSGQRTA